MTTDRSLAQVFEAMHQSVLTDAQVGAPSESREATARWRGPDVDIKALIRSSRLPERRVPVCLRGDLVAAFEDLDRQLAELAPASPGDMRLNQRKPAAERELVEKMAALRQEMVESTVSFRLRALSLKRWNELFSAHPPRKGEDGKVEPADNLGVNVETFFPALLRVSVVEPALDSDDWAVLLGEGADPDEDEDSAAGLTDHQFDTLAGAAYSLNRRDVDIPFSRAASRILRAGEPA